MYYVILYNNNKKGLYKRQANLIYILKSMGYPVWPKPDLLYSIVLFGTSVGIP